MHGRIVAVALSFAFAASACADAENDTAPFEDASVAPHDTVGDPGIVTGTTGAPGPGTVGTPGTDEVQTDTMGGHPERRRP